MKKTIEWVFLLLETEEEEMIFVEENNEKDRPWKRQGQYFFPAGTKEDEESLEKTIDREFEEETWLNGAATIIEKTLKKIWELLLETEEYLLKANVYTWKIPWDTKIKEHKFNSHEIKKIIIDHPNNLLNTELTMIRPWLIEALLLKEGIPCKEVVFIENWVYKDTIWTKNKIEQLQQLYLQK